MVQNPPPGYQRVIPYLAYDDAAAALAFLTTAFGFEERIRMPGPDGTVMHAEVGYQDNVVMLASAFEEMGSRSPKTLGATHTTVLCYVDDVDAHYERAKAGVATILSEPEDKFYGDRMYGAEDPGGHRWYFATHVKDVAPEDMKPPEG